MDTTKAPRTKPRSRLFDRAINSVKNQSSSPKLKIIEDTGHLPCTPSRKGSAIHVDSQDLAAIEQVSSKVQYPFMTPDEPKNSESHVNDLSLNTNVKTYPEGKSLLDSSSNISSVDYNLPICQSDYLLDNPGALDSFNRFGHERMYNSSNNVFENGSEDNFLGSFKGIPINDVYVIKSPDCSSDNTPCIGNPNESAIFKEKCISKTVLPVVFGPEAKDPYLDKIPSIDQSIDLKCGSFIENCSEDVRCINHDYITHSNTSQEEYYGNKFLSDECDKSSLLMGQKYKTISLPKTNLTPEPKNTGIDSRLSCGSSLDNQDSGYMGQNSCFENESSSKYTIPIQIVVSESKSAIEGVKDSRCDFEFIDSNRNKTPQSCRIKVTLEVLDSETSDGIDKHSSISNFSKSSSACMLPITVQIAEYEGEFSKSDITYSSGFANETFGKSRESYNLPVAILISESRNSVWIPQTPDNINVDCAVNNAKDLSANDLTNTSMWNNACSKITRGFTSDKTYSGKRNTSDEHLDKLLGKKYCSNDHFPVHIAFADDQCMMNFPPKDTEVNVMKSNFMDTFLPKDFKNTKTVSLEEAPFENNTQNPKSLCESCLIEYGYQYRMFITQFKNREIDTSECTCTTLLEDSKSDCVSGQPIVDYNLPKFSSPGLTNFKNLDLTLSPINGTAASLANDWNLSKLPNDFSLPISSSCCELNPFFQEERINPTIQHEIKSSFSCENYEFGNSLEQDNNEENFKNCDSEERDKRQDGECFSPGCDFKMLYSTKFGCNFIDSHCHLDFLFQRLKFRGTLSEYRSMNEQTFPKSYEGCIAVFCEPDTFINKSCWEKYMEENVWGSFGCHPHFSRFYCERYEHAILEALKHPQVKALGEIGLDYSKNNHCTTEIQHKVFQRQLKICVSRKLPLVLHCRDAHEDTLKFAKEILPNDQKIHLHCFTDTWHWAKKWMDTFPNLCIGFTNHIVLNTSKDVYQVVKKIPLDRLLLETDAPYFLPKGFQRRKYSHPGMAIHVAAQIAAVKEISLTEVLYWARKNTGRIYGI